MWWRDAVFYEVYVRSFADSDGDGTGDLRGVADRLDHVARLGADAVWLTPFYASPGADAGYDITDHRAVDPALGTLDDVDSVVRRAHELGLRVVVDVVPNHVSEQHPWFREAREAPPGHPSRSRFHIRPGRGDAPPTDWQSIFGGPAWTRLPDGEWYLNTFDASQPDLDWRHPDVPMLFEEVLRFWLDRGVDGIRVDAAGALAKDPTYPDLGDRDPASLPPGEHPSSDRPEVHEIYASWRRLLDSYEPPRYAVGEVWGRPEVVMPYAAPGRLDQAFTFDLLFTEWSATAVERLVRRYLDAATDAAHLPSWVLGSHDVTRAATRWPHGRARALLLTALALPGSFTMYAGDELGLPEVDVPPDARQDPTWRRSGHTDPGRDGCRVPLPWHGDAPPYGFSTTKETWLPQPDHWVGLTVAAQEGDPTSTLAWTRRALAERRRLWVGAGPVEWLATGRDDVAAFTRGDTACILTTGAQVDPARLLGPCVPVLGSRTAGPDGMLPPDSAGWFRRG